MFQKLESDWDNLIERFRNDEDGMLMLMQIIVYNFRNLSIRFLGPKERLNVVKYSLDSFVRQKLRGLKPGYEVSLDEVYSNLNWETKRVSFDWDMLITSDNPAVLTRTLLGNVSYGPFFLPISPTEIAIGYDRARYKLVKTKGTDRDIQLINTYVGSQRTKFVYCHRESPENWRNAMWEAINRFKLHDNQRGTIAGRILRPAHPVYGLSDRERFSFLDELTT